MSNSIGSSLVGIRICSLEESGIPLEELHSFVVGVFQERLAEGLNFKVAHSSFEAFVQYLKKNESHVFVAIDPCTQKMVGTSTIIIRSRKGVRYGHHGLWAVSAQGRGIGSKLLKEEIEYAKSYGLRYVESDTAEEAKSSVRAHLKNGFVKAGYYSFPFTNYYSVYFRQLCSDSFAEKFLFHRFVYPIRFFIYYVYTRITKRKNGSATGLVLRLRKIIP